MDLIDKLLDLQKQATMEQSHYYVAACITEAIQEIIKLRQELATITLENEQANKPDRTTDGPFDWNNFTCMSCGKRPFECKC